MKTKSRACEWRICAHYRCRPNPEKKGGTVMFGLLLRYYNQHQNTECVQVACCCSLTQNVKSTAQADLLLHAPFWDPCYFAFSLVTIGRYSAKFQLPTSTAVLLVVVFSRTWLTPSSWQECCLGQTLVQIIAYLLTFWSSRFDSNRGLEGFYRPYMRYQQL
jgi:hypothetical protein